MGGVLSKSSPLTTRLDIVPYSIILSLYILHSIIYFPPPDSILRYQLLRTLRRPFPHSLPININKTLLHLRSIRYTPINQHTPNQDKKGVLTPLIQLPTRIKQYRQRDYRRHPSKHISICACIIDYASGRRGRDILPRSRSIFLRLSNIDIRWQWRSFPGCDSFLCWLCWL